MGIYSLHFQLKMRLLTQPKQKLSTCLKSNSWYPLKRQEVCISEWPKLLFTFLGKKNKIFIICTTITVSLERALKASGDRNHTLRSHIFSHIYLHYFWNLKYQIFPCRYCLFLCLTFIDSPVNISIYSSYILYFRSLRLEDVAGSWSRLYPKFSLGIISS